MDTILLNSNHEIPNICFGSYGVTEKILDNVINYGFNFIDTAHYYKNHSIIQKVLYKNNKKIFICTKLWINQLNKTDILKNCKLFLQELDIPSLDLLLIHWPINEHSEFIIENIWPELENLVELKLVKSIGVSNFGILDLQKLLSICKIKPAVNQILVNPYNTNETLVNFCRTNNIVVMAYSPFGEDKKIFDDDIINSIANKYNVSTSSIVIKWLMEQNIIPIVYTSSINHLIEYFDKENYPLAIEDKNIINTLNENLTKMPNWVFGIFNMNHYYKYNTNKYQIILQEGKLNTEKIFTTDRGFLEKCKMEITQRSGYLVCDSVYNNDDIDIFLENVNLCKTNISSLYFIHHLEKIYKYIDNLLILTIIEHILGNDCKISLFKYIINKPNSEPLIIHRDYPFFENPNGVNCINSDVIPSIHCIICLNDFTSNNGSTCILPRSYRNKEKPEFISNTIFAKKGSVIIGRGDNWHTNNINTSEKDSIRMVIEFVPSNTKRHSLYNNCLSKKSDLFNIDKITPKLYKLLVK